MTSTSKTKLEEVRILVFLSIGWIYWLASAHSGTWAPVPRPVLRCAECGNTMRVVQIIHDPIPLLLLEHGLAYLDSG